MGSRGVEDEHVVETGDVLIRRRQALAGVLLLVPLGLRAGGRRLRPAGTCPRAASVRSTCTHGVATKRPQPDVPNSTAAGLRDPYMSACHRGSIVSSAPRRSNCTGCSRHGVPRAGRGPPSPMPSTGTVADVERQRTVRFEAQRLDHAAAGVAHGDAQRRRLDDDAEASDGTLDSAGERPQADRRRRPRSIGHRRRGREVARE